MADAEAISGRPLCEVDIRLDDDAPLSLGRSPWRNRRVSYIAGGRFDGELMATGRSWGRARAARR
jgi:hypothetical protein